MEGCPFCDDFKKMLKKEGIEFFDRDIDKHEKEYDMFVKITENEMVPALLLIQGDGEDFQSFLYAPERNYNELTEAIEIINEHRKKIGII